MGVMLNVHRHITCMLKWLSTEPIIHAPVYCLHSYIFGFLLLFLFFLVIVFVFFSCYCFCFSCYCFCFSCYCFFFCSVYTFIEKLIVRTKIATTKPVRILQWHPPSSPHPSCASLLSKASLIHPFVHWVCPVHLSPGPSSLTRSSQPGRERSKCHFPTGEFYVCNSNRSHGAGIGV